MQVLVVLISQHRKLLTVFEREGVDLLDKSRMPSSVAEKVSFLVRTFDPERIQGCVFEKFLLQGGGYDESFDAPKVDGVVVLYEDSFKELLHEVRHAVFAAAIPRVGYIENVQNFLIGKFSTLLGNYGRIVEMMEDSTQYQAMSLPIRNFNADELRDLTEVCRGRALEKTFQNEITPKLHRLLKLRGPKRRSSYPHSYFKDENNYYFRYGHEHHSKYETGDEHKLACAVNGLYRFGNSLNQDRHYNVTAGDGDDHELIRSQLLNCHGEVVTVKSRTHINMFSNDFHK